MNDKLQVSSTTPNPTVLKVVEPQTLRERINDMYDSIARRAFAMFEEDGGRNGHDLDHWFKAEQEMLHPVHMSITDGDGKLTVQAEVPGFNADELQLSVEPYRLTIAGKKTTSRENHKKGDTVYQEWCSSEILRQIDLPEEVDASKAAATLKNGVLELTMPKVAAAKSGRASAQAA
jgi:HSP20 family molecular chaperone IbpA